MEIIKVKNLVFGKFLIFNHKKNRIKKLKNITNNTP